MDVTAGRDDRHATREAPGCEDMTLRLLCSAIHGFKLLIVRNAMSLDLLVADLTAIRTERDGWLGNIGRADCTWKNI